MSDRKRFFVTGGTGLVGAGVIAHLLRLGHEVFGLCRGNERRLEQAARSVDPKGKWIGILHPIMGDVTEPGVSRELKTLEGRIDVVVHSAGNTKFNDTGDANRQVNFEGTRNVVEAFDAIGCDCYVQISTAYVCGKQTGRVYETATTADSSNLHNKYEDSKWAAEQLVRERLGNTAIIVRPSIVVGALGPSWSESVPPTLDGYYGYFKPFSYLQRNLDADAMAFLQAARIPGDVNAEINIIPLDNVAEIIVAAAIEGEGGSVYHATNPRSPHYGWLVKATFAEMGIAYDGNFVTFEELEGSSPEGIEQMILDGIMPFRPYIGESREFDTTNLSQIYDITRIPAVGNEEVRRLIGPAIAAKFQALDKRLAKAASAAASAVA